MIPIRYKPIYVPLVRTNHQRTYKHLFYVKPCVFDDDTEEYQDCKTPSQQRIERKNAEKNNELMFLDIHDWTPKKKNK